MTNNVANLVAKYEWSFQGECGPQTWSKEAKKKIGNYQSPINIETAKAEFDPLLELDQSGLEVLYGTHSCAEIQNTGHSFQVNGFPDNKSRVTGGPVKGDYHFLQFHMHWGYGSKDKGSEHLIDGRAYAAELHFVNWNSTAFTDPKLASSSSKNDGLLVMSVLVDIGEFNDEFEKVSKCLHDIHLKDEHVPVHHIDLRRLLPNNLMNYWTYKGSLTTAPFSESVQWVVFKEPIQISAEQLDKCHQLYDATSDDQCNWSTLIKYNDRPIFQLGNRKLYKSFDE